MAAPSGFLDHVYDVEAMDELLYSYSPDTWLNSPSSLSRAYGMWRMDETHWTKEVCEQLSVYVWEEVDALVAATNNIRSMPAKKEQAVKEKVNVLVNLLQASVQAQSSKHLRKARRYAAYV
eukprot:CAMPEP_0198224952 /NCGR_PEP_ID=MMETSP1445-20131203/99041_1 /TAXON_ID=36898 /ORGANISM="Pyramimonas sp., Strain CCMP2087" /LENGTH=120 /DNA_ID=CAMNT_0043904299 /DNA_START=9 /DNA_END=367 /DNA_ORIENTATION=+